MTAAVDLFAAAAGAEKLPMRDAEVSFLRDFYAPPEAAALMQALLGEIPWRQETIRLAGKAVLQPRLSSWHGDPGADYGYSGITLHPHPWTATLSRIRADIERQTGQRFNSVLANLYRDGGDSMGWHSDDEAVLGEAPVIASLSLGATRIFRLRHKKDAQPPLAFGLTDGSLLLMAGQTQRFWRHAVPRESAVTEARINLTFRLVRGAGTAG